MRRFGECSLRPVELIDAVHDAASHRVRREREQAPRLLDGEARSETAIGIRGLAAQDSDPHAHGEGSHPFAREEVVHHNRIDARRTDRLRREGTKKVGAADVKALDRRSRHVSACASLAEKDMLAKDAAQAASEAAVSRPQRAAVGRVETISSER